jgi:hypothetical protein
LLFKGFNLYQEQPTHVSAPDENIKNLRAEKRYPMERADPPYS